MGSGENDEGPLRDVSIKAFAVGITEVSFGHWELCVRDQKCTQRRESEGNGRNVKPVVEVSWFDIAHEFLPWLRDKSGNRSYRLPNRSRVGVRGARGDKIRTRSTVLVGEFNRNRECGLPGMPKRMDKRNGFYYLIEKK